MTNNETQVLENQETKESLIDKDRYIVHNTDDEKSISIDESIKKEYMSKLEEFYKNPEKLMFTEEEMDKVQYSGFMDKKTSQAIMKQFNSDVAFVINDDVMYSREDKLERLKGLLESKESLKSLVNTIDDFNSDDILEKVFALIYPDYKKRKSAWTLEDMAEFMEYHMKNSETVTTRCRMLTSTKKMRILINEADKILFNTFRIASKNGKPMNMSMSAFIKCFYIWNKERIANIIEVPIENITPTILDPIAASFISLFLPYAKRRFYDVKAIIRTSTDHGNAI